MSEISENGMSPHTRPSAPAPVARWSTILPVFILLLVPMIAGPSASADELEELVARFEADRSKPYAERYQMANEFAKHRNHPQIKTVLIALYRKEADQNMKSAILRQLGTHAGDDVDAIRIEALRGSNVSLQYAAAQSLRGKMSPRLTQVVVEMLAEGVANTSLQRYLGQALESVEDDVSIRWLIENGLDPRKKEMALLVTQVIGRLKTPLAVEPLHRLTRGRDAELRIAAFEALAGIETEEVREILEDAMGSRDGQIAAVAMRGLARFASEDEDLRDELLKQLKSRDLERKLAAADALGLGKVTAAADELIDMLDDRRWQVRAAAILNLRRLRVKEAIGVLIDRLEEEDGRLRGDIVNALEDLTGKNFGMSPGNWVSWWGVNGDSFVVPPASAAKDPDAEDGGTSSGYYGIRILSQRVIFIVDHSGSMSAAVNPQIRQATTGENGEGAAGPPPANRLEMAKQQLARVIAGFDARVHFNIFFFHSTHQVWNDRGLVQASPRNKNAAIDYAKEKQPTGGTNIFDPLEVALQMRDVDTIFLLSDGSTGSGKFVATNDILREVAKINQGRRIKINCIAVGSGHELLKKLAEQTGGQYVEVR